MLDEDEQRPTELVKIRPHEVSLVRRPANRRRFLAFKDEETGGRAMANDEVVKQAKAVGLDLEALAEADEAELDALAKQLEGEAPRRGWLSRLLGRDEAEKTEAYITEAELEARLEAERAATRKAVQAEAQVATARKALEAAVVEGRIVPAAAERLLPVVERLAAMDPLTRKAEDGAEEEIDAVQALLDALALQGVVAKGFFTEVALTGAGADDNPWAETNYVRNRVGGDKDE
jgi:hypothetical protein